ncbi:hypothetical protein AD16_0325 [Escherichia coli 3-267-03_S4_C2]|nr:hypothetical protein AD16_0325 [Escherichia coli 3-267-03_S4_C2]KEL87418.1 hypothetical protein AC22_0070 [Escherichia coli 5-366-08_S3_C2]
MSTITIINIFHPFAIRFKMNTNSDITNLTSMMIITGWAKPAFSIR